MSVLPTTCTIPKIAWNASSTARKARWGRSGTNGDSWENPKWEYFSLSWWRAASQVRPEIFGSTETGATNDNDIGVLADGRVGREDGSVDVFAGVITCAPVCLLTGDGEMGVGGDISDLTNAVHAERTACTKPALTVDGVMPATRM